MCQVVVRPKIAPLVAPTGGCVTPRFEGPVRRNAHTFSREGRRDGGVVRRSRGLPGGLRRPPRLRRRSRVPGGHRVSSTPTSSLTVAPDVVGPPLYHWRTGEERVLPLPLVRVTERQLHGTSSTR